MEKVLDRMRTLCSRREYCKSDIMKKALKALEDDAEKAEKVIAVLIEEKYLDELRYASAFARDKSSLAGWGETKIRYMLSAKGVPRDVISQALEEGLAGLEDLEKYEHFFRRQCETADWWEAKQEEVKK